MKTFLLISTILIIIAMVARITVVIINQESLRVKIKKIISTLFGNIILFVIMPPNPPHIFYEDGNFIKILGLIIVPLYILGILFLAFSEFKEYREIKKDPKIIWKKIYKKWFGLEKDFSNLQIPKKYNHRKHFAVIAIQEVSMNDIVVAMGKKFKVFSYSENLDGNVNQNDRTLEGGDYVVLFNRNVEADEKFKNLSASQLKTMVHKGTTLMERLLLEVFYFNETKKHLDINNITLCSGSRDSFGDVPSVDWHSGSDGLCVGWCISGHSGDSLRSRAAVVS